MLLMYIKTKQPKLTNKVLKKLFKKKKKNKQTYNKKGKDQVWTFTSTLELFKVLIWMFP